VPVLVLFLLYGVFDKFYRYPTGVISHIRGLTLGRLSVVYDQAGKARVVAISNY
jgi:hypothetical protein